MDIRDPKELGRALRAMRKALGLTQSEVALVAACGVRFIVEAEAGKPTLRLDTLLRVIQALGATLTLTGITVGAEEVRKHA